jgi:hypothetical protein
MKAKCQSENVMGKRKLADLEIDGKTGCNSPEWMGRLSINVKNRVKSGYQYFLLQLPSTVW